MRLGFIGRNDLEGVEADARFAQDHGFDGLEYNFWADFSELTQERVGRMRKILDAHGIECCMLGLWGWNFLSADEAESEEARRMLDRAIEFGAMLGARIFVTGTGKIPEASLPEQTAAFVEMFKPRMEKIEEVDMKCALFPLHGASFITGVEAYEAIWEHLPQIGIKFDPANWSHQGHDYVHVVRRYGDRIAHVHIKEHLYHDGELASQPAAGMGDIQWGKVIAFLYEHDFDGYLSMEPHGPIWSKGDMRRRMLMLSQRYIQQFMIE